MAEGISKAKARRSKKNSTHAGNRMVAFVHKAGRTRPPHIKSVRTKMRDGSVQRNWVAA